MKQMAKLAVVAAAPILMAALWMDEQPSYKPYRPPVLSPPAGSVPVSGKEVIPQGGELKNPVLPTAASLAEGKTLFDINCAMCHGMTTAERGPVGLKLTPPPPALDREMVRGLSDATIFRAVTFGFGRMPPFQEKLTPHERWSLVNFLRTRK